MSSTTHIIEADFRTLSIEEKAELIRRLLADLDGPIEDHSGQAWSEEAKRRLQELNDGKVQAVAGDEIFAGLQSRLKGSN